MPKCCVPGCYSGYKSVNSIENEGLHLFTPPYGSILLWQKAIPRQFQLTRHHRVCHKHFPEQLIIKSDEYIIDGKKFLLPRTRWKLVENAVPQIFPNFSKCLSKVTKSSKVYSNTDEMDMNKLDSFVKEEKEGETFCKAVIEEQEGTESTFSTVDIKHEEGQLFCYGGLIPVKQEESLAPDDDMNKPVGYLKKENSDETDHTFSVIGIKQEEELKIYYGESENLSNEASISRSTFQLRRSRSRGMGQGVAFRGQAREIVANVRDYFEREKAFGGPLCSVNKIVDRTAGATKVSKATVCRIASEKNALRAECGPEGSPQLRTPGKKRSRQSHVTDLDSFQEEAIRDNIYGYYKRKEHPTLRKMLQSLEDANLFSGGITALSIVLKKLGFKYKSICGRKLLTEKEDIVLWRCRFLRAMISPQLNFETVVWLGETCVNAGHTINKTWKDEPRINSVSGMSGKSGRFILRHAGTSNGFIFGAKDLLRSKKTGDFHDEMSPLNFKEWFQNKLLCNLEKPSIIVMDNAPYHSEITDRAPTANSTKAEILLWLTLHSITANEDARKIELLDLVNQNKPQLPSYEIDELAAQFGHKVLRVPPYHCHFNPIELIWTNLKGYVAINSTNFTITEVERLINDGIERITAEDWRQSVQHVKTILKDAWETDGIVEEAIEEIIIRLSSGSVSSSTDEELEDDDDFPLE